MLKIWGRANSVNVQKVLWCCDELGVAFERIDAGLKFGVNKEPGYLVLNPNGRVPMIADGDFHLWESNAIMRYLALEYGDAGVLYPTPPRLRASIERWLDWTISTLAPVERTVFLGYVRTPPDQRDETLLQAEVAKNAELWKVIDIQLKSREYLEAETFSLADIALGCFANRWLNIPNIARPPMPDLERWYGAMANRPAFRNHLAAPLS